MMKSMKLLVPNNWLEPRSQQSHSSTILKMLSTMTNMATSSC